MAENMENVIELLSEIKHKLDNPPTESLVYSIEEIGQVCGGKSASWAYTIVREPDFPAPLHREQKLSRCWLKTDVHKWLKRQKMNLN